MPAVAVENLSMCQGHDSCAPVKAIEGDSTVLVNGRRVVCMGHKFDTHGCKHHGPHNGVVVKASSIMFVNGRAVARMGDLVGGPCPTNPILNGDPLLMIDG